MMLGLELAFSIEMLNYRGLPRRELLVLALLVRLRLRDNIVI
jgi:hypothetical protein